VAQTASQQAERQFNLPPFEEIPEPFLQEMNEVYNDCEAEGPFENVRDCRCYALSFLETKVQNPFFDRQAVEIRLETACLEPDKLKQVHYQDCLNKTRINQRRQEQNDRNINEACACYSEFIAERIVLFDDLNSNVVLDLKSEGYGECNVF
jgi:hypothetical protein